MSGNSVSINFISIMSIMSFATMTESRLFYKGLNVSDSVDTDRLPLFSGCKDVADKPACHICGTRRQRNLIISFTKRKGQSLEDYFCNPENGDKHVICFRCDSLNLSQDDLRYMKDRYFPTGNMGRYKDLKQKMAANSHKRDMGGD